MIGWRWVASGAPGPLTLIPFRHDIAPRRSYELPVLLSAPQSLGAHTLLLRTAGGRTAWVATTPRAPLRFSVQVDAPTSPGIAAWLPAGAPRAPGSPEGNRPRPRATVRLNASRFEAGAPIAVDLDVSIPPGSPVRDVYAGVLLPDRRNALFFRGNGTPTPAVLLTDHRQFVALAAMDGGLALKASPFFRGAIPIGAPPGRYELFILVTTSDALRKPDPTADDVLLLQTTSFEVLP